MPAHARPSASLTPRQPAARQPLASRPTTVITLGLAVSALLVATVVHAPTRANANQEPQGAPTALSSDDAGSTNMQPVADTGKSRLVRLVDIRQERMQRRHERAMQQAREKREQRQERQERRADARAAARAAARAPQWVMPVPGAGWSASYGESGSAWSSGYHTGQDFTASAGTPVLAVSDGTITSASWSDAYGNIIEITHPNGDQSWYAHMSGFEQTSGAVSTGDVIGYVGCTGNCSGNHLHFEYHPGGGAAADPIAWLQGHGL